MKKKRREPGIWLVLGISIWGVSLAAQATNPPAQAPLVMNWKTVEWPTVGAFRVPSRPAKRHARDRSLHRGTYLSGTIPSRKPLQNALAHPY